VIGGVHESIGLQARTFFFQFQEIYHGLNQYSEAWSWSNGKRPGKEQRALVIVAVYHIHIQGCAKRNKEDAEYKFVEISGT